MLEKAEPSAWNELYFFFYLLISDGAPTNQLAARFVLAKFKQVVHLDSMQFSYLLQAHSCSSYQGNLVVTTAIQGLRKEDPEQLVANCSRFYKHPLSDYLEELSAGMRRFVENTMKFRFVPAGSETEELLSQRSQMSLLQDLYGKSVLLSVCPFRPFPFCLWGCVCWCPRPWLGWCPSQGYVRRWHSLATSSSSSFLLFSSFFPFRTFFSLVVSLFSLSFAGDSERLRSLTKAWLTETFTYKLGVPEHLLSFPENLAADEALQRRLYSMALLLGNSLSQQTKAGAAHGTLARAAV